MLRICLMVLLLLSWALAQSPNQNLEPIGFLLGDWEGKFKRNNRSGKEVTVNAVVRTRWRLQGQMLEMEETQTVEGGEPSTALLLVTYDAERRGYQGFIFTSSMPSVPMGVFGKVSKGKLEFEVDAEQSEIKAVFTYERLDDGHYRGSSSISMGEKATKESAEYRRISKG